MKFPRIQNPCPLTADQRRAIDGHCGHCDKHVHRLDAMSETARRALLAAAREPICVAYAQPVRVGARLGAAMAASLVSAAAMAAPQTQAPPTTQQSAVEQPSDLAAAASSLQYVVVGGIDRPQAAEWTGGDAVELARVEVVGGGIDDPAAAKWVDTSDLPELPVEYADGTPVSARAPR
ncbi:hypothetical protein [Lysobacter claricitrinus]|uniref:hypothetical protein n=1 Tax=Lysobacter claricitrinus TaxID=3367728 RepID=UPI0037DB57EE